MMKGLEISDLAAADVSKRTEDDIDVCELLLYIYNICKRKYIF